MWRRSASVWRSDWPSRLRMRRISRLVDPKTGLSAGGSGNGMLIMIFVVCKVFQLTGLQSFEKSGLFSPQPLLRREVFCARPPSSEELFRCLAGIIGEKD